MNKLNIVSAESGNGRLGRRKETEARFDRLWLVDPEQFNPLRNSMERERIDRTLILLKKYLDAKGKKVADLGCGAAILSRALLDLGAEVNAVDISGNALKKLSDTRLNLLQDYVPHTRLSDDTYDLVLCTELIGYLPKEEHRMLFSELARLVKSDGYILFSSAMDINSLNPVQQLVDLAETELKLEDWRFSYHLCWIRLKDFMMAPARFARARRDPEYRAWALSQRQHLSYSWFKFNSRPFPGMLWALIQYPCAPLVKLLKTNRTLLTALEKFCHFFWSDAGISHAIFIGKRRPLYIPPPENELPREVKHKKQVWE